MEASRAATEHDLPRLAELARLAISELTPTKGGDVWALRNARREPVEGSMRAALADPATRVLCGTIDDAVVGYSVVRTESLEGGARLGVLDDIFVEPGARQVGLGEAMVAKVIDWCREQGCIGIDSIALPGNRATKNFFETFGFISRMLVVHHRLVDPSGPPEATPGSAVPPEATP